MQHELQTRQMARYSLSTQYEELPTETRQQLKRHLLDAIGSLIHASSKPATAKMARQIKAIGEGGNCRVPLLGSVAPDRAAQWMTALIRYPDFMDNFMGKEATCHPSDNIGAMFAATQLGGRSSKDFLLAMAIAYQIECRLVLEIPVMIEGIDHTLMLGYSLTAGIARLLGLTDEETAHALAIAGTSISPMVTSRAAYTYEWKGFASSLEAFNAMNICLLAVQGLTGPVALFEGPKGFHEVFDMKLRYDWSREDFSLIPHCVLKSYNAEVHSQATLEAVLDLRREHKFSVDQIEKVEVTTFLTAFHIIGSGAYGDRQQVETKEQADHSLFYLVAVALIDGDVYPEQLTPSRIEREDVQQLLRKVHVGTGFPLYKPLKLAGALDPYTQAYPDKMKTKVSIHLSDGQTLTREKEDYHGFFTRPFTWDDTIAKFRRLTGNQTTPAFQDAVVGMIRNLEEVPFDDFVTLLSQKDFANPTM